MLSNLPNANTLAFITFFILASIKELFFKYIFADLEFLGFLGIIILVDTILGIIKGVKFKEVSAKKFGSIIGKLILYGALLIMGNVLTNFKIHGANQVIFSWIDTALYTIIVTREAWSILENLALIYPDIFPKSLRKIQAQFDDNGNLPNLPNLPKSSTGIDTATK